jgi:hypothetical protein
LVDREAPLELELKGDAWRDLAGRRLQFVNPTPKSGDISGVAQRQSGAIGDCTASRKVKVPEIPLEQIGEYYKARKPFPWHWGNSLYLEWFSEANGRVVIESAIFQLTIDPEAAWEMSPDEEDEQRRTNAEAMGGFFQKLGEAVAAEHASKGKPIDDTPPEWGDDNGPMTEEEAEKMQEESDRLADRINARVEREGIENYERILEEELDRRRQERGEKPLTPEEEARRTEWIEEMNRAAEESATNPGSDFEAELEKTHPVAERAFALTERLMHESEDRQWIPARANNEHPVADLVSSVMSASAKLAGALNGQAWPPEVDLCAHAIVRLKRAQGYLDHALLAAESCAEQKLVDAAWLANVQREIAALGGDCAGLIKELRARLDRGFD